RVQCLAHVQRSRYRHLAVPQQPGSGHRAARDPGGVAAEAHRRRGVAGAGRHSSLTRSTRPRRQHKPPPLIELSRGNAMKLAYLGAVALAGAIATCVPARAQDQYPSRLITMVVPLTPGTAIDILARPFAERLSKRF